MKLFFSNIWKYLAIFFAGIIAALVYAMKQIKPNISAGNYYQAQDNNIGKIKNRGEGDQTVDQMGSAQPAPLTRREIRRAKRQQRREARLQAETEKEELEQKNF